MARGKRPAAVLALLAVFVFLAAGMTVLAAEDGDDEIGAAATESVSPSSEPADEPQQEIRGTRMNPRRLRTGVAVTTSVEVKPVTYKGPCPATLTLKGYVSANNPTTVMYKFVRKEMPSQPPGTLEFDKPGTREVSETFTVGTKGKAGQIEGWAHLEAVFPVNVKVRSDTVFFSVSCTAPGNEMPATVGQDSQEDCDSFDPTALALYQEKNIWKIGDGRKALFQFGVDKTEAENSFAILRQYGITSSCFVGRPKPSFHYLLAGNAIPTGEFRGEACKVFAQELVEVRQTKTGWVLGDAAQVLLSFGDRRADADRTMELMKKYGATRLCTMATGRLDYLYMRK